MKKMIANIAWRTWLKVMALLCLLLPGFPLLLIAWGEGQRLLGWSQSSFYGVLILGGLYYQLPTAIFGEPMFPVEEFGPIPTPAGYAVAAILYAVLAFVISFPICWLIRPRMVENDQSRQGPHHLP